MPDTLIAALEAATGPDRDLDAEIARCLGGEPYHPMYGDPDWIMRAPSGIGIVDVPAYTGSLDAAMTMIPAVAMNTEGDGWWLRIEQSGFAFGTGGEVFSVHLFRHVKDDNEGEVRGHGSTIPIATALAALRAREAANALKELQRLGQEWETSE